MTGTRGFCIKRLLVVVVVFEDGFDTAHACGRGLLLDDAEVTELAGASGVRTAANLFRVLAHGVNLDFFAVLGGEKSGRALRRRSFPRKRRARRL